MSRLVGLVAIATTAFVLGCQKVEPPLWEGEVNGRIVLVDYGKESKGEEVRNLINVLVYRKGDLTRRMIPFYLPRNTSVSKLKNAENERHLCIFDSDNLGFIVLVDKDTGEFFVSRADGPRGGLKAEKFEEWQRVYANLKDQHKDLPYGDYFK